MRNPFDFLGWPPCPDCGGRLSIPCDVCGGRGSRRGRFCMPCEGAGGTACGRCDGLGVVEPTRPAGVVIRLDEANFEAEVLAAPGPVLVAFTAPGCGPCRRMLPLLEQVAVAARGRAGVARVDVADAPGLAARFGVSAVPTFVAFRAGRPVARLVGVQTGSALLGALQAGKLHRWKADPIDKKS